MSEIKTFDVEMVDIDSITLDASNPNEMDELKMSALRKIMKEQGFLQPIIIDQDSLMCDGEHRFIVMKEFGVKTIPCYRLKVSDSERRLLRQTMNKIRGNHNPREDIDDIIRLSKELGVRDLSEYMGLEEKNLSDYIASANQAPESFLEIAALEKGKKQDLKMVTIKLTDEQAKKILESVGNLNFGEWALVPVGGLLIDNIGK